MYSISLTHANNTETVQNHSDFHSDSKLSHKQTYQ